MFTRVSEEERETLFTSEPFTTSSDVEREKFVSLFCVLFPNTSTNDRRERVEIEERKKRGDPTKKKISRKEWPGQKKIRLFWWREKTKKFIEARAANIFVIKPRTFFSLRNYVCIAKLYFHRRESCLGEIRQDDQKVRIILSRYRWIFGKHIYARKIFLVTLSRFVLYFLPQ